MLPYFLIAAGLGLLLTMVMYMRLAKRQEQVQRGLYDATAANETVMAEVRQRADDAQTAVQETAQTAEHLQSSFAAQEPLLRDAAGRVAGVESQLAMFEKRLATETQRSLDGAERARLSSEDSARALVALQDEAQTLSAAVQKLRNTSDQRLAEFAARIEQIERAVGMGSATPTKAVPPPTSKAKPKPPAAKLAEPTPTVAKVPEPESASSSVISAMAAPSVLAGQKAVLAGQRAEQRAAQRAALEEPVAPAAASPSQFDDEADDEIDEGSARWIFVVLGLMLALAVVANVMSR